MATDDGAPIPLEGGVGKQLFDGDVLIEEDGGVAVGEVADAAPRPALGGDRFDLNLAVKGGELPRVDEDQIRAEIAHEAKELSDRGIETRVELADVTAGGPAHAIVDITDRNDGDLIVTGTRGHGSVAGLMLGGVAHRLLHIAKRPTLAVPS